MTFLMLKYVEIMLEIRVFKTICQKSIIRRRKNPNEPYLCEMQENGSFVKQI